MKICQLFIVSLLAVILAGCETTNVYRQPMTVQSRHQIGSDQLVLTTNQKQLQPETAAPSVDYMPPGTMAMNAGPPMAAGLGAGFGTVLGDLIVSGMNHVEIKHATEAMQPVNKTLKNFDLANYFKLNLTNELNSIQWLQIKNSSVNYNLTMFDEDALVKKSKENTTLLVDFNYSLNYRLNAVVINADVKFDKKNKEVHKSPLTLYRNSFTYLYYLPNEYDSRAKAVEAWSSNNGALVKNILRQGAKSLAQTVAQDINDSQSNLYASMKNAKVIYFKCDYGNVISGKLANQSGNTYIIRMPDDAIYIINENALSKAIYQII